MDFSDKNELLPSLNYHYTVQLNVYIKNSEHPTKLIIFITGEL